jgi:hypothetical protein
MLWLSRRLGAEQEYRQMRWLLAKNEVLRRRLREAERERLPLERLAIVVRPREPYFAWARSLEADSPIDNMTAAELSTVYLVPEGELANDEEILRRHHGYLFAAKLHAWMTKESTWPAPRTWEMFREWFDAEVINEVHLQPREWR